MASAVATWDGQLPETEILESPEAFREWFDDWMERRKHQKEGQSEEHGWVLK